MFTVLPYRTQVTLGLIMNTVSSPQNGCFVGSDAYSIGNHNKSKYLKAFSLNKSLIRETLNISTVEG